MTEMSSRPIRQRTFARQATEPGRPVDGFLWVNTQGGNLGNNTERYYWNSDTDSWELESAVGPDTPLYAVSGSTWRDTANSTANQYDGAAWQPMGVTDHANLTGVTAAQHHAPVTTDAENATRLGQAHGTSGTHATFDVTNWNFQAAVIRAQDNSSGTNTNKARTHLELVYGDATTRQFSAVETYDGADGTTTTVSVADLDDKSYILSGIDTINLKWNNDSNPDDANATVDHEWSFKGWEQI